MIRYFRINDPYRLAGTLVLFLLLNLPLFIDPPAVGVATLKSMVIGEKLNEDYKMYSQLVDNTAPLAAWSYEFFETLFGRSLTARHIFAFIFVFLQSAYLGMMMINRKVFNENTYIPSFLFLLLFFFSYDTISLTGELLGFVFLLPAINNIFREIEFRTQRDETVFNLGAYISLASLFSFGYSIFLFFAMAALITSGRITPRKFLLLTFGFLLPHLLVLSVTLLSGVLPDVWQHYYLSNLSLERIVRMPWDGLLVLAAVPTLYFLISSIMLQREARLSKYQSLLLQLMFLWIGFCFIYLLFCKDLRPQNLIVFIPGMTTLITHFLLFIRRRRFVEINGWVLLLGVVTVSYLARYEKLDWVSYEGLQVRATNEYGYADKRLLVLEDDMRFFLDNQLATPYLNWALSKRIFEGPDYYENVTDVYHAFTTDPPDIVIDKRNYLKPFLERIPELAKEYRRRGDVYVRATNN